MGLKWVRTSSTDSVLNLLPLQTVVSKKCVCVSNTSAVALASDPGFDLRSLFLP